MKIRKNKKYETRMAIWCPIVLIILIIILALIQEVQAIEVISYKNYVVKPGDTLWSIALNLDKNENIQKTIFELRKDNNNLDPVIYPGQVIKLREEVK